MSTANVIDFEETDQTDPIDEILRLRKDLRDAAATMTADEARYLVDYYYILQKDRIRTDNQVRQMGAEPHVLIGYISEKVTLLENNVKSALHVYAKSHREGRWALSQHGIGPVITAGLLAHVDIEKARSPSAVWRFAGLDPTAKWGKGEKRPWNARLKVLCWHMGECFKRSSNSPKSVYGKIYRERKERRVARNEAGEFAALAQSTLEMKNFSRDTKAKASYIEGKLPPGRLDLQAMREAVKIFLSHYWAVSYEVHFGKTAPNAWVLEHGGHVHNIEIPNWPLD